MTSPEDLPSLAALALTRLPLPSRADAAALSREAGGPEAVWAQRRALAARHPAVARALSDEAWSPAMAWAAMTLAEARRHHISILTPTDSAYPCRLAALSDAPQALHTLGPADLNAAHILSVVGTRRASAHGIEATRRLVGGLAGRVPGLLVVSGLAYGIDITAHRTALAHGIDTAAVLAHGLHRIYPAAHRDAAVSMARRGALITEYPLGTDIERRQFVERNRIVAALSDVTLVAESDTRGGSLITASMAHTLSRTLAAVPGSPGCDALIAEGRAVAVDDADTLLRLFFPSGDAPVKQCYK